MDVFELTARYDARKSFYGKAHVIDDGDSLTLMSYATRVMRVDRNGDVTVAFHQPCSQTTARHMREFSKQFCGGIALDDCARAYL